MTDISYDDALGVEDYDGLELEDFGSSQETWNQYAAVLADKLDLPIRFRYVKGIYDDPVERRIEHPSLRVNRAGDLLIVGEDPDRRAPRSFRVDRITDYITVGS